jgi:hypothetical protein
MEQQINSYIQVAEKPKKERRGISVTFFLLFFIFWTIISLGAGGYLWFRYSDNLRELIPVNTQTQIKIEKIIEEKPVYITQNSEARYVDQESASDVFNKLLTDSAKHFTFEYKVADPIQYKNYQDFVLVNLENQYARLSAKFDIEMKLRLKVILVDDFSTFKKDVEIEFTDEPTLMAVFYSKDQRIEIFVPKKQLSIDKFLLASVSSHEMVHAFQYTKYSNVFIKKDALIWLYEGMAEDWKYPKEDSLIRKDLTSGVKSLADLNSKLTSSLQDDISVGYAVSGEFFKYLEQTYSEAKLVKIFDNSLTRNMWNKDFNDTFKNNTGILPEQAFQTWLAKIAQ